jgi:hypothetical protein
VRLALWHAQISRNGPGLLLRDLEREESDLIAYAEVLRDADADIIVLTRFDYDATGLALRAFADLIGDDYAFFVPLQSNAGLPTQDDIDGDGRFGEPEDAQAYGRFPGQEASAVLSRFPIVVEGKRGLNDILWADLPGTHAQADDIGLADQRLSSGGHWIVPIEIPDSEGVSHRLSLLIGHAGAPVFDGPEDRNGRRNLDELRLWEQILDGRHGPAPEQPLVFMANTNLDPSRGEGYREAMAQFLAHPRWQDPLPGEITAHWERPGHMRVSYVLPASSFGVAAARVWKPLPDEPHSLITVDIDWPDVPLP